MAEDKQPEGPRQPFGARAPALTGYSEEALFEQVWEDPDLFPRGWNLTTGRSDEQLAFPLGEARENGLSDKALTATPPHGVPGRVAQGHVRAHRRPQCPERRLLRPPSLHPTDNEPSGPRRPAPTS
ncbi:hypothetical protein [Streptomyces flaveolus]|uniref:hypothetical protein n=1 Tax=Streptomyces flaveolus TaxID=67297 RepID=UPI0036FE7DF4